MMSSAAGLWKLFRDQAERGSGIGLKLFASSRNRVHLRPDSSLWNEICLEDNSLDLHPAIIETFSMTHSNEWPKGRRWAVRGIADLQGSANE